MATKQKDLPGMEDWPLKDLEDWAEGHVEIRDKRMGLTKKEVESIEEGLALMKKHRKQKYHRGAVRIEVVTEKERVKVRINDKGEAEAE